MIRAVIALLWVVLATPLSYAQSGHIALLVGNEAYTTKLGALNTPANDVTEIKLALVSAGFRTENVRVVKDLGRVALLREVANFAERSKSLAPDDIALFYYAGHAIQDPKTRHLRLVPTEGPEVGHDDFLFHTIGLEDDVVASFERASSDGAWIIAVDACRNELRTPQRTRGEEQRGFSVIPAASGMLISFSADEGQTALDSWRGSNNSPYAIALVEELKRPGRSISQIFGAVRPSVVGLTEGRQQPVLTNKLNRDPHIRLDLAGAQADLPAALAVSASAKRNDQSNEQDGTWTIAKSAAVFMKFLSRVVSAKDSRIVSRDDLDQAFAELALLDAEQLSSGWVAYLALAAASHKPFADAVREAEQNFGRDRVLRGIQVDLSYARTLKGADEALQKALSVNAASSEQIRAAGVVVNNWAYELSQTAWGGQRHSRDLAADKRKLGGLQISVSEAEIAEMSRSDAGDQIFQVAASQLASWDGLDVWDDFSQVLIGQPDNTVAGSDASAADPRMDLSRIPASYTRTANRIISLAALGVLKVEASRADVVVAAQRDSHVSDCLAFQQALILACSAASSRNADVTRCIAQHALLGAGKCFEITS